jgi:hypothetical protein
MKNELSKERMMLGLDVVSSICTVIHVPILLRRIYKRGSATPAEALSLVLNGVSIGASMNRLNNYIDEKLESENASVN